MANYIARVELHGATHDDYEELHESMRQRGFSRMIRSDDGKNYHLPTGTYVARNTSASRADALNQAGYAAQETGKKSSIVVADWDGASWRGLPLN